MPKSNMLMQLCMAGSLQHVGNSGKLKFRAARHPRATSRVPFPPTSPASNKDKFQSYILSQRHNTLQASRPHSTT
jgi:hypothetical protein